MTTCVNCGADQDPALMVRGNGTGLVCKDRASCDLRREAATKQPLTDLAAGVIPDLTDTEIDGFLDGSAGDSPGSAEEFIRGKEAEYHHHMATGCRCMTLAEYLGMTPQELDAWHDRGEVSDRVRRSWALPPASPGSEKAAFHRTGRGSLRGELVMEPEAASRNLAAEEELYRVTGVCPRCHDQGAPDGCDICGVDSIWAEAAACPECAVEPALRGWRKLLVPAGRALAWFFYYGDRWLDWVPGFNAEWERLYSKWAEKDNAAEYERAPEAGQ